jgi:hypothetical protein
VAAICLALRIRTLSRASRICPLAVIGHGQAVAGFFKLKFEAFDLGARQTSKGPEEVESPGPGALIRRNRKGRRHALKPGLRGLVPGGLNEGATHRRQARTETSSRAVASAHAPGRGTRPNSGPWGIDAILARTAGRLSSSIANRTALAAGRLSNAVAARTASRAA